MTHSLAANQSGSRPNQGTRGHMSSNKSSFAWIAYALVYVIGCAALMYLSRTSRPDWPALWWAFLFPVVLAGMAVLVVRAEASEPPRETSGSLSILGGGGGGIRRVPIRPTTLVALTMLGTPLVWIFPAVIGSSLIDFVFLGWWLACTAFVALLLPILVAPSLKAS